MTDRFEGVDAGETRDASSNDGPGAQIGPYKLLQQIGEGGFGEVFVAEQSRPVQRRVALKVIKLGMDSRQVVARFEAERQALALMDHPHIARVFDGGTTPAGRPYFVMELVKGEPITEYCDAHKLSIPDRLALFDQVCTAVQHAHGKGVIHRDIKPNNVLVSTQEDGPSAKVIDFGIAKATSSRLTEKTIYTEFHQLIGTPEYMSPEQAEGSLDIDTRTDVYALGVLLYELLTGVTPFDPQALRSAGFGEIQRMLRDVEPPKPSTRLSQLTVTPAAVAMRGHSDSRMLVGMLRGELDWIVMKAIEKDRGRRYETANGLAMDVRRYLSGEPVLAAPPGKSYRLRKFARKHRLWFATAAAFTLVLVAGVIVSAWMAVRARRAERVALAVSDFLKDDVLAQASANTQARPGSKPDPDIKVRTALDQAAARIKGKFDPVVEASIRLTIGTTYSDLGLYHEAQGQMERVVELRRRELGETHPETLQSMDQLGLLYTYQGHYAQAEPLLEKTLEVDRRVLGEEHKTTLDVMNNLAMTYKRNGKYAQAEPLFERVLEIDRRVLGAEQEETLTVMNNLGSLYQTERKFAQAESLLSKTLEIARRMLGEEHPSTITIANNLALTYDELGQYAQAERLYGRVYEFARRVWGEEHPNTLTTMGSLAENHRVQGRSDQAESLLTKALEIGRRVQGEDNFNTLRNQFHLAALYRDEGRYAEADALLAKELESERRVQGKEHPDSLKTSVSLGRVRLLRQKYGDAEALLKDTLASYEKADSENWDRYYCQSLLGASLAGQRKYDQAEAPLIAGYQGMVKREASVSAQNRKNLEQAADWIVDLYRNWNKPEKVAEWTQTIQQTRLSGSRPSESSRPAP
jgi:tetratricopeptide (TPR) repeat protein